MSIHAPAFLKRHTGQHVQLEAEITRLCLPAVEKGGDLAQAFFKLRGGTLQPAPAHPNLFHLRAAGRLQKLGHGLLLLGTERLVEKLQKLR